MGTSTKIVSKKDNAEDVRSLLSEESIYQAWIDVEAALAKAQVELGIVPLHAAQEIDRKARLSYLDVNEVRKKGAAMNHYPLAVIKAYAEICENDAGGYVHWGATSQNITQTGFIVLLNRVHKIFLKRLSGLLTVLANLAEENKDVLMAGRTHGQHALPITFGYKIAVWIDEISRHVERLRGCEHRVFQAMLGGAVGTAASLGESGLASQKKMAEILGLGSMSLPGRNSVDHLIEYVTLLGMLASTCKKIAREIHKLMKPEFGEVEEPVAKGVIGSTTMPQKRNPNMANEVVSWAAQLRALVPLALEGMEGEHEADLYPDFIRDKVLTESCILMDDILKHLLEIFSGIKIFPEKMKQNVEISGGLIVAEAIMLELGKHIGRQKAHEIVFDAAQSAAIKSRRFREVLSEVPEIKENLTPDRIDQLLDPMRYIGLSSQFALNGAKQARKVIKELNVVFSSE